MPGVNSMQHSGRNPPTASKLARDFVVQRVVRAV
jgi:hypothetical protein